MADQGEFCTECGKAVSSPGKFCAGCGHQLGDDAPPPSSSPSKEQKSDPGSKVPTQGPDVSQQGSRSDTWRVVALVVVLILVGAIVGVAAIVGSDSATEPDPSVGGYTEDWTFGDETTWNQWCMQIPIPPASPAATKPPEMQTDLDRALQDESMKLAVRTAFTRSICTDRSGDIQQRMKEGWSKDCALAYYSRLELRQEPDPYMCE
jgi:hypothetical protein